MTTIAHETSSGYKPPRRRIHCPSFVPAGASPGPPEAQGPGSTRRNFFSSPLPSAAVQGMNAVGGDARHALMQMNEGMLGLLEKEMERHDPRRTGTMSGRNLRDAFARARVPVDSRVQEAIISAYALDNESQKIWWAALFRETHDMRKNGGRIKTPSPTRRWESPTSPLGGAVSPGGGVAGTAAPYFNYSEPLDSPVMMDLSEDVEHVLRELAMFFTSRRVDVADAFTDFEMPGRFCKRVRRVTRFQFQEVLYFITKGLSGLTADHVALLSDTFDDGTGLIRYREFIKAVDLKLEDTGTAGAIPHAANSNPPKTATLRGAMFHERSLRGLSLSPSRTMSTTSIEPLYSPSRTESGRSRARSLSPILPQLQPASEEHATKTAKLLGVQPMGPESCQSPMPARISVYTRLRADTIMARLRETLQIYNILLIDHLRITDRHAEGWITCNHFRRQMDQLRVFRISSEEFAALEREYQVTGPVPGRFDYRTFCCDLQPVAKAGAGPGLEERLAALPRDNSQTSPLAVRGLEEDEMQAVKDAMRKIAFTVRHKRLDFRGVLNDFDRTTKTRSGSTPHNYTLLPGCVSRSQFQQALAKMQLDHLVETSVLTSLYKRYDREGGFNQLVFIREIEALEAELDAAEAEAIKSRYADKKKKKR